MSDYFKFRAIVARDGEEAAQIVGGMSEGIWEVIPPEEWDAWKRRQCEDQLGPDWTAYDFAEAVLHVSQEALDNLFAPLITEVEVIGQTDHGDVG